VTTTSAAAPTVSGRRPHPRLDKVGFAAVLAATRLGTSVLRDLPDGGKRLLMGGRSIAIDGNTLDPSLRMLLASQKLTGTEGLSTGDDVVVSRQRVPSPRAITAPRAAPRAITVPRAAPTAAARAAPRAITAPRAPRRRPRRR
jgi:acetyl esterase